MRRRAKVDRNHSEIVEALRKSGWLVLDLSRVGRGCPDLLAVKNEDWRMVEIKAKGGRITEDQEKFLAQGWPVTIVRSVEEALSL